MPDADAKTLSVYKPTQPIMGGLEQTSLTKFMAWTGGKPKLDWTGLDSTASQTKKSPKQLRATDAGSQSKTYSVRTKGLETKYGRGKNLTEFVKDVQAHLGPTDWRPSPTCPRLSLEVTRRCGL